MNFSKGFGKNIEVLNKFLRIFIGLRDILVFTMKQDKEKLKYKYLELHNEIYSKYKFHVCMKDGWIQTTVTEELQPSTYLLLLYLMTLYTNERNKFLFIYPIYVHFDLVCMPFIRKLINNLLSWSLL